MTISDLFASAKEGVSRNRVRSALTLLGIIIGVGSVVLMISIASSFERYILDQVETFGGSTFEINAKGLEQVGKNTLTITLADYEAISKLTTVKSPAPAIFVTEKVTYGREEIAPFVLGTTDKIFLNWNQHAELGRLFQESDIQSAKTVAVIGSQAAEDLFENENPIGKRITIGPRKFTVIGVLEAMGSPLAEQFDSFIYVTFPVAKSMMGRDRYIDYISLQAKNDIDLTKADIVGLLRHRHSIVNPDDDPDKDDFIVRSFEQATDVISSVTFGLSIFLGIIAGISLIVGGIGIMNIMLVSVNERTREIGLRKAVGATRRDIFLQFLLETILLTGFGGLVGVGGGIAYGMLLAAIADKLLGGFSYSLSIGAVALSFGMAILTGIVFGATPALRASKLQPTEALRYE